MAGIEGEQLVASGLGHVLNDEWTLIRGYRNKRGEIDHLLLGPHGLIAIEGKHRNALVHCAATIPRREYSSSPRTTWVVRSSPFHGYRHHERAAGQFQIPNHIDTVESSVQ